MSLKTRARLLIASLGTALFSVQLQAADGLVDRFARLSCAVVHLEADGSSGTGFFINKEGDILTASHVILNRSFKKDDSGLKAFISLKPNAKYIKSDGTAATIQPPHYTQLDAQNSLVDLATIHTNSDQDCFLHLGKSDSLKVGEHLIGIGFPGSSPTGVLYEGFLSAKHSQLHTLGPVVGQPSNFMQNTFDVLRVQMPVTPGASGAPIIADDDTVVGVMSEVPVATLTDVDGLIQNQLLEGPHQAGIVINGFDTLKVLAEVAFIVREFESPGSGLAVPIDLLHQ